jgi:hypothetical protein
MKNGTYKLNTLKTAILVLGILLVLPVNAHEKPSTKVLKFDVVEDASRFVFASAPVFEDGFPAYGNPFVTQGYIYPRGFLDDHAGVTETGEPAYPEQVIGVWTCRGVFVGDGAHTSTGPMVISTQTYDFFDEAGYVPGKFSTDTLLISEGYELIDANVPFSRALTGGTGTFSKVKGEAVQTFLGFNQHMGVRLRFTVKAARLRGK